MPSLAERWRALGSDPVADWNDALPVVGAAEFYRGRGGRDVTKEQKAEVKRRCVEGNEFTSRVADDLGLSVGDVGHMVGSIRGGIKGAATKHGAESKRRAAAKSTDRVDVSPAIAPEPCTPEVNVLEAVESAQGYTCHRCGGDQERMENYDEVCSLCQEEEREESVQEAPARIITCCDCEDAIATVEAGGDSLCIRCYVQRAGPATIPMPTAIPLPPAITCCACACDVLVEDVLCCDCTDELREDRAEVDADRQADAILESVGCILGAMTLDQYHSVSVNMRHAIDVLMGVMP